MIRLVIYFLILSIGLGIVIAGIGSVADSEVPRMFGDSVSRGAYEANWDALGMTWHLGIAERLWMDMDETDPVLHAIIANGNVHLVYCESFQQLTPPVFEWGPKYKKYQPIVVKRIDIKQSQR